MNRKLIGAAIVVALSLFSSCRYEDSSPNNGHVAPQMIKMKVDVKLQVGEFLYENIETPIDITGFDDANNVKWSNTFSFVGPTDTLQVLSGFDHYTISIDKWGVTDNQTITAKQLYDGRADGPATVTYGLGGKVPYIRKPIFTLQYWGGPTDMKVQSRTEYSYNPSGTVRRITYYENYTNDSTAAIPSRYQTFEYESGTDRLTKLTTYYQENNFKASEDNYEYGVDGNLLKITESNYAAALTSAMNLSVDASAQKIKASYSYSNGRGFDYEFTYNYKNLVSDKTTQGSETCNNGAYTYDRNINPFKHLGYVPYLVSDTYSINNRITENIDYIACGFPVLVPTSHSYKYDDLGYPTEKITKYKDTTLTSAEKYYYVTFGQ